ncbi:MAG: acetyl-CoA C-acetyltransferase [Gammaproteobacteria bacterium]|nr:acetyl-CoA C-acetyltransferase [Gammaproteobacteria bacterium]
MNSTHRKVAILGGTRIPFCRSHTQYASASNQDMLTAALAGIVRRFDLHNEALGDVACGAVIKHSKDWNLARESVLGCGLSASTPAFDLQRACGTSLEAAILLGNKISVGQIDSAIAGGSDTTSDAPIVYPRAYREMLMQAYRARSMKDRLAAFTRFRPGHLVPEYPGVNEPRTKLSMGESTEMMAKEWGISRAEQDALALASHEKAAAAYDSGFFADLVVPFRGASTDNNLRRDSSLEKLAKLKPAFDRKSGNGTLTAGNSTPLTDGAAAVLLSSQEWAAAHNLDVQSYLTYGKVAAVDFVESEGLLMAPAYAVSAMLEDASLTLQDFDFYEIHEAFAAQVLCTLRAWESEDFCRNKLGRDAALGSIDMTKLNVTGSSLALGHPFAATGARILATASKLLEQKGSGRTLISICTAGGMGVTAIIER